MLSSDKNIIGAKLVIGNELIEAGISIIDGKIHKIAKKNNLPKTDTVINAKDLIIIPGLIDAHVHLRDMQLSYKEDFFTGTCASASGGFTTILDMPNTIPPTITCENLKRKINSAKKKTIVNLGFHAMLTNKIFELHGMARMGAFSFKLYLNGDQNSFEINDDELLYELMQECEKMKVPLTIHAEDPFREKRSLNGSLEDLADLHNKELEINAVKRIITLAKKSKVQIHICHVSTFEALALIEKAKKDGSNISCEATPHHLLLSNESFNELGSLVLTDPPIRDRVNAKKLWNAMINGKIDMVASDHAPHTLKEKLSSNICDIPSGIPGLETTVPLLLTKVNSGRLTLSRLVEVLAEKPSKIFQMRNKGRLKEGMDADLTLIDLKAENVINSKNLYTKSEYSPFEGFKCKGKVSKVILAGEVIVDSGEIIANSGSGEIIRRG